MPRLRRCAFGFALAAMLAGAPAGLHAEVTRASDAVALPYVQSLRDEGYSNITVGMTWLGRVRIFAWLDGKRREIVLHPTSGEVLRDVVERPQVQMADESGSDDDDPVPTSTATVAATLPVPSVHPDLSVSVGASVVEVPQSGDVVLGGEGGAGEAPVILDAP